MRRSPRLRLRPWRHWTLRSRMVVTTAVLAAVALVVADVAGLTLLRSELVGRVDAQLDAQTRGTTGERPPTPRSPPGPPRPGPRCGGGSWVYLSGPAATRRYTSPSN